MTTPEALPPLPEPTSSQAREALNALECRIPMELARTHGAVIRSYIERAERAEADARRYKHLRYGKARTTGGPRTGRIEVFQWQSRGEGEQLKGEALDAAIDAALAARSALPKEGE
jgi:hypothetical protein